MKAIRFISGALEIIGFVTVVLLCVVFAISNDTAESATNSQQSLLLTVFYMLGMLVYGVLFILKRFPRFMVYPVKLEPSNIGIIIPLSKLMLVILKVCFNILFIAIVYSIYAGQSSDFGLPSILILLMALAIPADIIIYLLIARRHAH